MGPTISYFFYISYILITIVGLITYPLKRYKLFVLILCVLLQVNVTSFFNVGIAWTGDFILSIEIIAFELFCYLRRPWQLNFKVNDHQKIWFLFFSLCVFSLSIVLFRAAASGFVFDLAPFARSLKSLIRYVLVFCSFFILANKILVYPRFSMRTLVKCISISSLYPVFFAIYQTIGAGSPMFLLQNNNTFTKEAYIVFFHGQRAVGLSAESSFFAYLLSFSFIATVWLILYSTKWRQRLSYGLLVMAQFIAMTFSISRTGLVLSMLAVIYMLGSKSWKSLIGFGLLLIPLVFIINGISNAAHIEYSLFERFASIGNTVEDLSNIERYGVTVALGRMLATTDALIGYGFFNYMFYLNDFLPSFMNVLGSRTESFLPSFNLILQLIVEIGILPAIVFFTYIFIKSFSRNQIKSESVKDNLVFHKTVLFLVIAGALSFNVLTFSFSFMSVLISSKVYND